MPVKLPAETWYLWTLFEPLAVQMHSLCIFHSTFIGNEWRNTFLVKVHWEVYNCIFHNGGFLRNRGSIPSKSASRNAWRSFP